MWYEPIFSQPLFDASESLQADFMTLRPTELLGPGPEAFTRWGYKEAITIDKTLIPIAASLGSGLGRRLQKKSY